MKLIVTALFLISSIFAANAGDKNDTVAQQKFVGVWQMCTINTNVVKFEPLAGFTIDTVNIKTTNMFKFFGKGGDFLSMFTMTDLSLVTITGTYEVFPGKYFENVDYHSNPDFANKNVELTYEFYGNNYFLMTYKNGANIGVEVWKRIKQGNVTTEINKLVSEGKIKLN